MVYKVTSYTVHIQYLVQFKKNSPNNPVMMTLVILFLLFRCIGSFQSKYWITKYIQVKGTEPYLEPRFLV